MENQTTLNKKIRFFIVIAVAIMCCLGVMSLGIISTQAQTAIALEGEKVEIFSDAYFANVSKSLDVAEQIFGEFRTEIIAENGEVQATYCDSFAGIFIDEQGVLNVATVAVGLCAVSFNARQFGEQVVNRQFTYSYNHLILIQNTLVPVMARFNISTVAICDENNRVLVYLKCETVLLEVSDFLRVKNLYSSSSIYFIVDSSKENVFDNRPAYAGDRIGSGTIGVNAVCNRTGRFGLLTNEHVALTNNTNPPQMFWRQNVGDAGVFIGGGNDPDLRGEFGNDVAGNSGTIDAAFIPFANQNNWSSSTRARREEQSFSNIRIGNESQIVNGTPVKKIGQTTGITFGTIRNRSASITISGVTITNTFRYCNARAGGDSGGPVYAVGTNGNLYLIGLHFGGHNGFFGIGARGYACRITEVMRVLDVTPLTNDSLPTTNIGVNAISIDGTNWPLQASFTIPSSINGRSVTAIGPNAFANNTSITEIHIPSTVTSIGIDAFAGTNRGLVILLEANRAPSSIRLWNPDSRVVVLRAGLPITRIYTQAQLSTLLTDSDGRFELANNITLVGDWEPIRGFGGELNGNGHTISRLRISRTGQRVDYDRYLGLFGRLYGTVRNLYVWDAQINVGTNHLGHYSIRAGVVAGGLGSTRSQIDNVTVEFSGLNINRCFSHIGGIAGFSNGIITNSTVDNVDIWGNGDMGGIVGFSDTNGEVSNSVVLFGSFSHWSVDTSRSIGGLVGFRRAGVIRYNEVIVSTVLRGPNAAVPIAGGLVGVEDRRGWAGETQGNVMLAAAVRVQTASGDFTPAENLIAIGGRLTHQGLVRN